MRMRKLNLFMAGLALGVSAVLVNVGSGWTALYMFLLAMLNLFFGWENIDE